jgi:hypothetical protein
MRIRDLAAALPSNPRDEVLMMAARKDLSPARREALHEALSRPQDWGRLVEKAQHVGVLPLLAHHVGKDRLLASAVPPGARRRMAECRLRTVAENLLLFGALEEVLRETGRRRIPVVPLKGAYLIPEVYGGFHLRGASDLDLLVRREDLDGIDKCLGRLGYVSHPTLTGAFLRRPGEDRYFLDLHFHLVEIPACLEMGIFPVDMDRIWDGTEPWSYGGHPARRLGHLHHLLFLCLHGMKHAFSPLRFRVDIAEFRKWMPSTSDEVLLEEARRHGLERPLLIGLALAGAPLRDGPVTPWERIALGPLRRGRHAPGAAYAFYLDRLPGWGDRLAFLRKTFFPGPEAIPWAEGHLGCGERIRRAARGMKMTLDVLRDSFL